MLFAMIQAVFVDHIKSFDWHRKRLAFLFLKTFVMPIVKVIEVIASSEVSFDDAVKNCLAEVSKTVHNIDSIYVKDFKVHVKDGKLASYGIICKVSFRVEPAK